MLVLTRRTNESVVIDGRIVVRVLRVDGDGVKLGIEAPAEISVHRQEVYQEIQQSNKEAATPTRRNAPKLELNAMPSSRPTLRDDVARKESLTPKSNSHQDINGTGGHRILNRDCTVDRRGGPNSYSVC
jgi:carbon storage regulator